MTTAAAYSNISIHSSRPVGESVDGRWSTRQPPSLPKVSLQAAPPECPTTSDKLHSQAVAAPSGRPVRLHLDSSRCDTFGWHTLVMTLSGRTRISAATATSYVVMPIMANVSGWTLTFSITMAVTTCNATACWVGPRLFPQPTQHHWTQQSITETLY